jgi:hypothetical protein
MKMKNTLFIAFMMIFFMSATTLFAVNVVSENDNSAVAVSSEIQLSEEEVEALILRVEEIRDMDKSNLTFGEKLKLRKELKDIERTLQARGGLYIGVGTLLMIVIIILLVR